MPPLSAGPKVDFVISVTVMTCIVKATMSIGWTQIDNSSIAN